MGGPEAVTICVMCVLLVAALWEPDELQDALDRQALHRAPVSPDDRVCDGDRIEDRPFGGFEDSTEALVEEPAIGGDLGVTNT
jgi:hypothetical protein